VPPDHGNFWAFAGTSCGGPQWAGLVAIADQMAGKRLGPINPALYAIGATPSVYHQAFHDITHGNNRDAVIGNAGYDTKPNWDPVTGLGTPDAAKLLPLVVSLIH
jgi:subtilase family serine protease